MSNPDDPTVDLGESAQKSAQTAGPVPGYYRHFKGNVYEVLTCVVDANTLTPVVIYRDVEKGWTWTRPITDWNSPVVVNGTPTQRFKPVP